MAAGEAGPRRFRRVRYQDRAHAAGRQLRRPSVSSRATAEGAERGVTDGSSGVGVGGGGARATRRQAAATAASGVRDGCGTLDASYMARSPAARILHALPAIQRQDAEFCRNGEGWEGGEVHASGRAGRRPCGHGGGGSGCIFCSGDGITPEHAGGSACRLRKTAEKKGLKSWLPRHWDRFAHLFFRF